MPNRLAHANSPYLLQHKDNPVDWYPWTEQALRKAQEENKPIFLSIGYAACHWCHVMAHESFEDAETASIMNRHFINIKVDREERPDLDSLYMNAVVALTGQGGWPMSVFLTPEGIPFYAGTYFPPVRRYNMPAFKDVLLSLANAWKTEREQVQRAGQEIIEALKKTTITGQPSDIPVESSNLNQAVKRLHEGYDWDKGGWGKAPKFPQPMAIQFLLAQAAAGDDSALELAVHALKSMARGGMYDVIGGGFSRYSTDDDWLVPHFEKMLYDNAQLARVYLHAYLLTREPWFREICEQTIDFVLRELTGPDGGFYSSLDADSEGEEGKFYLWSLAEIQNILGDPARFNLFESAYNLVPSGNFEGQIILQRRLEDDALAEQFNLDSALVHETLKTCHQQLFQARSYRTRPSTDDKALVSWNALMLVTLSEAARYLSRLDYLEAATRNADFILKAMLHENHLLRSWRNGKAHHNAYLEDYAALVLGLLSLYQSSHQNSYLVYAEQLTSTMIDSFYDPEQGFFDTRHDHGQLFMRPRDIQDNAVPSGTSLAVQALLHMAALYGHGEWREIAEITLGPMQPVLIQYPTAFASWLSGLYLAVSEIKEVAILGDPEAPSMQLLIEEVWKKFRPDAILAVSQYPPTQGSPPLLDNRSLLDGKPTAYVCRNFVCKLPVTNPEELAQQIN